MKIKIILDTNFLLVPSQFNVDIFSEIDRVCNFSYGLFVVKETITELKGITYSSKSSGKDKKAAKLALLLLKKLKVKIVPFNRKVFKRADETIIAIADKECVVATQDIRLRRKLRGKCSLIILRQKQYLKFYD